MCKRENRVTLDLSCVLQCSIEGAHGFSPRPVDMSNVTLSRDLHVSEPHINSTSGFTVHIYIYICVFVCFRRWPSCWQRTITTFGLRRKSWSWNPKVCSQAAHSIHVTCYSIIIQYRRGIVGPSEHINLSAAVRWHCSAAY